MPLNEMPVLGTPVLTNATEDQSYTITSAQLLSTASDVDGDSLNVTSVSIDHGTIVDNLDGTYTVTPEADYNGTVQVSYSVSDGTATVNNTVSLTYDAVNDAPVVSAPITLNTIEDTSILITQANLLANASDIDGDSLNAVNLTASSGNLVDNLDGTWTLTPAQDAIADVTLNYSVTDGTDSTAATGQLSITAVNDAPALGTPVLTNATEDQSYTVTAAQLLSTASDVDGDSLNVTSVSIDHGAIVDNLDGTYTVMPEADYNGSAQVSYSVSDGTATVNNTVSLTYDAVNDAPAVSAPVTLNTIEDTSILITLANFLLNAADIEGDSLNAVNLTANSGNLVDNLDGTWTLTPAQDAITDITLNYSVTDGTDSTATTGQLSITAVNDAAVQVSSIELDDILEQQPLILNATELLSTFSDVDGDVQIEITVSDGHEITSGQLGVYVEPRVLSGEDKIHVSLETIHNQHSASTSSLKDGGYVVSWTSVRPLYADGVLIQRFDDEGHKIGNELQANTVTGLSSNNSSVAGLEDGGFVVAWQSKGGEDGSNNGIYAQRYDADGAHDRGANAHQYIHRSRSRQSCSHESVRWWLSHHMVIQWPRWKWLWYLWTAL